MSFTHDVTARHERYQGPIFAVVTDEVTMPGGNSVNRDYVEHQGAVGVVALDEQGRVVLIRQYRHPVRRRMWELPAGIRDLPGEDPAVTAARELAEEADLVAGRLEHLIDLHTSPGFSDEMITLYLATELSQAAETFEKHDEEADLEVARFALDEAVAMILRGDITNGPAVGGLLAAAIRTR